MVCVYCGQETSVVNSRHQKRSNQVWRRRRCEKCTSVFTTLETADREQSFMVRHAEALQPFLRDKLYISIFESCGHRPTAVNDATALTATVLATLLPTAEQGLLTRGSIIQIAQEVLERFDNAAAVHYSAYHQL